MRTEAKEQVLGSLCGSDTAGLRAAPAGGHFPVARPYLEVGGGLLSPREVMETLLSGL